MPEHRSFACILKFGDVLQGGITQRTLHDACSLVGVLNIADGAVLRNESLLSQPGKSW